MHLLGEENSTHAVWKWLFGCRLENLAEKNSMTFFKRLNKGNVNVTKKSCIVGPIRIFVNLITKIYIFF